MDWSHRVIPFHLHPLGMIDAFSRLGANLEDMLKACNISRDEIQSPNHRISYLEFSALIEAGMDCIDPHAPGLAVAETFRFVYHGTLGLALKASSTFNQAGLAVQRYTCIAQPYYTPYRCQPFFYLNNQQEAIIPIEHFISEHIGSERLYRFETEFRMGLLYKILQRFGSRELLKRARFELDIPPSDIDIYERRTLKHITYNCTHSRLIVPVDAIEFTGNPLGKAIYKQCLEYCDAELEKVTNGAPCYERVRTLLLENLPTFPDIESVAKRMDLSARTLARKLKQESTSYSQILNDVRSDIAIYLLKSTQLSIEDIAESMGFSDPGNFRSAFARWTGSNPNAYRRTKTSIRPHSPPEFKSKLEHPISTRHSTH